MVANDEVSPFKQYMSNKIDQHINNFKTNTVNVSKKTKSPNQIKGIIKNGSNKTKSSTNKKNIKNNYLSDNNKKEEETRKYNTAKEVKAIIRFYLF